MKCKLFIAASTAMPGSWTAAPIGGRPHQSVRARHATVLCSRRDGKKLNAHQSGKLSRPLADRLGPIQRMAHSTRLSPPFPTPGSRREGGPATEQRPGRRKWGGHRRERHMWGQLQQTNGEATGGSDTCGASCSRQATWLGKQAGAHTSRAQSGPRSTLFAACSSVHQRLQQGV